jgi:RNA polymerase primary sigma factor
VRSSTINEGNIGLMYAARRFDPERGVKFITYAVWWIRQAISHALSEQAVRCAFRAGRAAVRLSRKREELSLAGARISLSEEIAGKPRSGSRRPGAALVFVTAESLSETFVRPERTLEDLLVQSTIAAADDELVKRSSEEQTRGLLDNLPAKERAVLCRRFGISENGGPEREPMTLQEIGDELKLSRERVRQIEAQAIARIKRTINQRKLHASLN